MISSVFIFGQAMGLERPAERSEAANMPVACLPGRGGVHRRQSAARQDCEMSPIPGNCGGIPFGILCFYIFAGDGICNTADGNCRSGAMDSARRRGNFSLALFTKPGKPAIITWL